jgi:PAS domain S-box-containing protein
VFAGFGTRIVKQENSRRFTAFFLMLLLVLSCAGMVYSAQAFRDRIDAVRSSDSDNAGWLISQLDVDKKSLSLAIDRTLLSDAYPELNNTVSDLSHVRLRFDIFYSRINTVLAAMQNQDISDELRQRLNWLANIRDELADRIDAMADDDDAALVQFANDVQATSAMVRDVTTMSLSYHVAQSDLVREMERSLLRQFWLQSIVLLLLMIVSAILALRLWRELEDRTIRMKRALDTVSKVFDVSLSAVIVSDMYGRILMANPAAAHVFRVPAEEMVGHFIEEVMVPPEQRDQHRQMLNMHRRHGHRKMIGAGAVRLEAVRMDGSRFKAEISIVADTDLEGKPILIGFVRDISEVVAAEEKLLVARDEAQRHASAKTMFLATMSHEMRTPLHGVIASLDLIDDQDMPGETQLLLQTARDCSDRALQQVNDVLEITRLGESRLGHVPFSPTGVARDILRELGPMAAARGIDLDLEVSGANADRMCLGLANAFSRALYNLAGNAVKFTDHGGVTIVLRFLKASPQSVGLQVEVRDTGIGIAPDDQERIFSEFETVESVSRFRGSGTGLGLPIVRLAVSRMGGQLSLRSEMGKGSTFCFEITLPFAEESSDAAAGDAGAQNAAAAKAAKTAAPAQVLEVLVVDDNDVNVTLMSKMVTRIGHRPAQAVNGLEAVAMASVKAYDIILMDVSMPVMDGREATGTIRAGGLSAGAVIIGVTAFSDEGRQADLISAGMDAVLTKPVNTAELAAAMGQAWEERSHKDTSAEAQAGDLPKALTQLEDMLDRGSALRFLEQALDDVEANLSVLMDRTMSMEQLADRIHSTVGSTAVVGLSQLSRLLAQAEDAARSGKRDAVSDLQDAIAQRLNAEKTSLKTLAEAD